MLVKIYDISAKDGKSRIFRCEADTWDAFPDDDDRWFIEQDLRRSGRCYVGGGAAPLVLLLVAR